MIRGQDDRQPLLFEAADVAHTDAVDFLPTPIPVGVMIIERLGWKMKRRTTSGVRRASVFDPSCGKGNLLEAARQCGAGFTIGLELAADLGVAAQKAGHDVLICDALASTWPAADFLLGNPPYDPRFLLPFCVKAAQWAKKWRRPAAFLLELPFCVSKGRASFHKMFPSDMHPLTERISFDGQGTAQRDYAVFVWGPGHGGRWEPW